MKKLVLFFAAAVAISFASCGGSATQTETTTPETEVTAPVEAEEATTEAAPEAEEAAAEAAPEVEAPVQE